MFQLMRIFDRITEVGLCRTSIMVVKQIADLERKKSALRLKVQFIVFSLVGGESGITESHLFLLYFFV